MRKTEADGTASGVAGREDLRVGAGHLHLASALWQVQAEMRNPHTSPTRRARAWASVFGAENLPARGSRDKHVGGRAAPPRRARPVAQIRASAREFRWAGCRCATSPRTPHRGTAFVRCGGRCGPVGAAGRRPGRVWSAPRLASVTLRRSPAAAGLAVCEGRSHLVSPPRLTGMERSPDSRRPELIRVAVAVARTISPAARAVALLLPSCNVTPHAMARESRRDW